MMSMKLWKSVIQQRKEDKMIADMESNKKLTPIIIELLLREGNLISHNHASKCQKL